MKKRKSSTASPAPEGFDTREHSQAPQGRQSSVPTPAASSPAPPSILILHPESYRSRSSTVTPAPEPGPTPKPKPKPKARKKKAVSMEQDNDPAAEVGRQPTESSGAAEPSAASDENGVELDRPNKRRRTAGPSREATESTALAQPHELQSPSQPEDEAMKVLDAGNADVGAIGVQGSGTLSAHEDVSVETGSPNVPPNANVVEDTTASQGRGRARGRPRGRGRGRGRGRPPSSTSRSHQPSTADNDALPSSGGPTQLVTLEASSSTSQLQPTSLTPIRRQPPRAAAKTTRTADENPMEP